MKIKKDTNVNRRKTNIVLSPARISYPTLCMNILEFTFLILLKQRKYPILLVTQPSRIIFMHLTMKFLHFKTGGVINKR